MNLAKELIKVWVAILTTIIAAAAPTAALGALLYKLAKADDWVAAFAALVVLLIPAIVIGLAFSNSLGTWFCLHWGKPYLEAAKEDADNKGE